MYLKILYVYDMRHMETFCFLWDIVKEEDIDVVVVPGVISKPQLDTIALLYVKLQDKQQFKLLSHAKVKMWLWQVKPF